jgi:curli biogenesis system outer membrane secretion channel CsgG
MKKVLSCLVLVAALTLLLTGVSWAKRPVLAVIDFTNDTSAGWWSGTVGRELADMLTNELASGGEFRLVERKELSAVLAEQDLGASGRVRRSTAAKVGRMTGAKYLVAGRVSAYEGKTEGTGGGIRIKGISLGGKRERAYLAIDLRVIDSTSGEIVHSRTVEATAKSGGLRVGAYYSGVGGTLGKYKKTPTGKAIRACMIESVEYLECAMVFQDDCLDDYRAKERRRREKTKSSIDLDD